MSRLLAVAVVILLAAGLVGGALITRYRYYDTQGVLFHRIDRWTGRVQEWQGCARTHEEQIPIPRDFDSVVSARGIPEGTDLSDLSDVSTEKPAWKAITQWISDAQKREAAEGHFVHGIRLWLALLADKKKDGKWDLVRQVCEPGWSSTS